MNKQSKGKSRLWSIIILVILCCTLVALPVLAEGQGDGSGGGKNIALDLVSSSPSDGQKDAPVTGDIKLSFNKNVIYLLIRDLNKNCFSLIADGKNVPIEVIMADDQTPEGFDKRRDIFLRPSQELQPGTSYSVKVSPQLQAKNGMSLGKERTVTFVTAGVAPKAVGAVTVDAGKNQSDVKPVSPAPRDKVVAVISEARNDVAKTAQLEEKRTDPAEMQKAEKKEPAVEGEVEAMGDKQPEMQTDLGAKSPAPEADKKTEKSYSSYAIIAGVIVSAGLLYYLKRKNRYLG